MGRDRKRFKFYQYFCSFNPRARMGRDTEHFFSHVAVLVSIHAPAWGATHRLRQQ